MLGGFALALAGGFWALGNLLFAVGFWRTRGRGRFALALLGLVWGAGHIYFSGPVGGLLVGGLGEAVRLLLLLLGLVYVAGSLSRILLWLA